MKTHISINQHKVYLIVSIGQNELSVRLCGFYNPKIEHRHKHQPEQLFQRDGNPRPILFVILFDLS